MFNLLTLEMAAVVSAEQELFPGVWNAIQVFHERWQDPGAFGRLCCLSRLISTELCQKQRDWDFKVYSDNVMLMMQAAG